MANSRRHRIGESCGHFFLRLAGIPCLLMTLAACGGMSNVSGSSSSVSSVSATCTPSTVNIQGTAQCAATVTGTGSYSTAVTWTASSGAISANGSFTAPSAAQTVTITAISAQDPS